MAAFDDIPSGARVLEIGCGEGALGARLAARFDYVGVESDAESARVARARVTDANSDAEVLNTAFEELPPEHLFDVVCAFEVIEHLEDDRAALEGWSKRLVPGGRMVLSTPAHQHRMNAWDELVGHYRRYDPGQLATRMSSVGLIDVRESMFGFPLGYVLEVARNWVGQRRRAASTMQARTSASGRSMQPKRGWGLATWALTLPFRLLQRPFRGSRLGTGLVASGRRT